MEQIISDEIITGSGKEMRLHVLGKVDLAIRAVAKGETMSAKIELGFESEGSTGIEIIVRRKGVSNAGKAPGENSPNAN